PVRAGDDTVLLTLHQSRDSLARLRAHPEVALTVLAQDNVAFTARGAARVVEESMQSSPDYAAVQIDVTDVDDHRQAAFTVAAGGARTWMDTDERRAWGRRVEALQLAAKK